MEETAAINLIKRAIEYDNCKRYGEAIVCYTEGIELLLKSAKSVQDDKKKEALKERICSYMERAEKLKKLVDDFKKTGKYHEQIQIEEDSTGNSYEKLLSRFFGDDFVDCVQVIDPYIRQMYQIHNFLRFCDMVVKLSKNCKKIILITSADETMANQQEQKLNEIKQSLSNRNIQLVVKYDQKLHDREIKLSSGWIIKIGRGLDYFKPPESRDSLCIGFHDLDLRPCYSTTIDIFHENATNKTVIN